MPKRTAVLEDEVKMSTRPCASHVTLIDFDCLFESRRFRRYSYSPARLSRCEDSLSRRVQCSSCRPCALLPPASHVSICSSSYPTANVTACWEKLLCRLHTLRTPHPATTAKTRSLQVSRSRAGSILQAPVPRPAVHQPAVSAYPQNTSQLHDRTPGLGHTSSSMHRRTRPSCPTIPAR